jgi:hypothetical protein
MATVSPPSAASPADRPPIGPAGPAGPGPVGPAGRGPAAPEHAEADALSGPLQDDLRLLVLARHFAAAYLEVEAGRRDGRQLAGLVTRRLALRLAGLPVDSFVAGRVQSVAGARSRSDRFDAVAVVRRGQRYGAIAIRIIRLRGRWLVDQAGRPERRTDSVRSDASFMTGRPGRR